MSIVAFPFLLNCILYFCILLFAQFNIALDVMYEFVNLSSAVKHDFLDDNQESQIFLHKK